MDFDACAERRMRSIYRKPSESLRIDYRSLPFCDEPPVIVTGIKYKQLQEEINNVYGMSS